MKPKPFHIGMRNFKTAFSIFICIAFFQLSDRGNPMIACIASAFAMREDISKTYSFGRARVLSTTLGGIFAFCYIVVNHLFKSDQIVTLIAVPIFIMLFISLSVSLDNSAGIISGTATMLMIIFSVTDNETILYAFNRVIDTLIGTGIAIIVNLAIKSPDKRLNADPRKEIQDKKAKIQQLNKEILELEKNCDRNV